MTRFEKAYSARCLYLGMKLHFETDSYDFSVYGPKTNVSRRSFEKSSQFFQFMRLSTIPDLKDLLIYTGAMNKKMPWVGDLLDPAMRSVGSKQLARRGAFAKHFEDGIDEIIDLMGVDSREWISSGPSGMPRIFEAFALGKIQPDVMANVINVFGLETFKCDDTLLWPNLKRRLYKYSTLIKCIDARDSAKMMMKLITKKQSISSHIKEEQTDEHEFRRTDEIVGDDDDREDAGVLRPGVLQL